jgi:hypothetical protein
MCCKKTTHGAKIITYNFGPRQEKFYKFFGVLRWRNTWRRFYHQKNFLSIETFPMLQKYHHLAGRYKFQDHTKIPATMCRTPRA